MGGVAAGRPTVQALSGDEVLFSETADTQEQAFEKARRRLGGGAASAPVAPPAPHALPPGGAWSKDVQIQPRAKSVPVPVVFHLEPGVDRRKWDAGNGTDSPSGGHHQVDPRRPSSMTPVMPDILLARATGNAYPPEYDPARMSTTPSYRGLVKVSHFTCALFHDRGNATVVELAPLVAGRFKGAVRDDHARKCVRDTLRDLRLYGLATSDGKPPARAYSWVRPEHIMLVGEG